jgi:hypothetical protein
VSANSIAGRKAEHVSRTAPVSSPAVADTVAGLEQHSVAAVALVPQVGAGRVVQPRVLCCGAVGHRRRRIRPAARSRPGRRCGPGARLVGVGVVAHRLGAGRGSGSQTVLYDVRVRWLWEMSSRVVVALVVRGGYLVAPPAGRRWPTGSDRRDYRAWWGVRLRPRVPAGQRARRGG